MFFKYKTFEGYLCVTHKRYGPVNYKHQFIVLSKEYPFLPIWKSDDIILDKNGCSGIEFACGLTQLDDESVIVSFGRFDCSANYRIYKFSEIFN